MAQIIRIKRRIGVTGTPAPGAPAALSAGELAYNRADLANGPDDLYVGDGQAGTAGVHLLVGPERQLEITGGAQTVQGLKTFSIGGATPSLSITGGGSGNMLTTNGTGTLSWAAAPPATVLVDPPITGDGTTGNELSVTPATFTPITGQIPVGTDNVFPVTSAGLRSQLGAEANAGNLGTTAPTVVPAIKELSDKLVAITRPLHMVGTYSATTNLIVSANPPAPPTLVGQPLPAAAAGNEGWFFILTTTGTGTPPAPAVPMTVGDWVLSDGTAWLHIGANVQTVAAVNVSATPPGGQPTWNNVQLYLNGLNTTKLAAVVADGISITGTGVTGDELEAALIDAGTY